MTRLLCAVLAAIALAGCQAAPKATRSATGAEPGAVTAAAPHSIDVLSAETRVWECPKCGMDYDGAGTCSMDGATLVETRVGYICPADGKPVEHSGKCPRCAANARVEKSPMAAAVGEKQGP